MLTHQDENIALYELMNKSMSDIQQRDDHNSTTDENSTQPGIEKGPLKRTAVTDKTANYSVKRVRTPLSPKPTLQTQIANPIHPRIRPQPEELPASGPSFARIQPRQANLPVASVPVILHHRAPTITRTTTRSAKPKRALNPLGSTLPPSVNANSNPAVSSSPMRAAANGSSIGSSATTPISRNPFLYSGGSFGLGSLLFVNKTEYLAALGERVRHEQSCEYSHIVTALGLGGLEPDKVRSTVQNIKTDMASMKDKLMVAQREILEYKTKLQVAERQVTRYRMKLGLVPLEKVAEKVPLAIMPLI